MKPKRMLGILSALALSAGALAKGLDAPSGLTLQAKAGGRYQMLWDPIYRDDLMGYSVWLRKAGEKEFTRLSVPVKVGKEVRKMSMTPDARLTLALGTAKRDLELTVVAEYEDGSSPRSASVLTRKAVLTEEAAAAPAQAVNAPETPTQAQQDAVEAKADDHALPGWQQLPQAERPMITPLGTFRSELGLGFDLTRSIRTGRSEYYKLRFGYGGIPWDKQVDWERIDVRTAFSVPLTLRLGVLPGIELWGRAVYRAEDMYVDEFVIDGINFDYVRFITYDDQENLIWLSNPTSAGLGDTDVGLRMQPLPTLPLLAGVSLSLPSGPGRFESMLNWFEYIGSPAGLGLGVIRPTFELGWGEAGRRTGLSFHAGYKPGVTERITSSAFFGYPLEHVATHGAEMELGGDFTFPWVLLGREGALALGVTVRSIDAATWRVHDIDVAPILFSDADLAYVTAHSGLKFFRDDQIEFSVQAFQDIRGRFRTGGKFSYVSAVKGDSLRLSGQFYY